MTPQRREREGDVTELLHRAEAGGANGDRASADLLPLVYNELRALAASFLGGANPSHTLQPTALVHEAYMKMVRAPSGRWDGRRHFFAVAAKAMRQILVNHARDKRALKRGGADHGAPLVTLDGGSGSGDLMDPASGSPTTTVDILALEEALAHLERIDPDQCRIVEFRYFAGLTVEETAKVLGLSESTVKREWRMAKAELRVLLGAGVRKAGTGGGE